MAEETQSILQCKLDLEKSLVDQGLLCYMIIKSVCYVCACISKQESWGMIPNKIFRSLLKPFEPFLRQTDDWQGKDRGLVPRKSVKVFPLCAHYDFN